MTVTAEAIEAEKQEIERAFEKLANITVDCVVNRNPATLRERDRRFMEFLNSLKTVEGTKYGRQLALAWIKVLEEREEELSKA